MMIRVLQHPVATRRKIDGGNKSDVLQNERTAAVGLLSNLI